ncbi:MAG TPA: ribonuclease P protein component [Thermoclostridium sp.]|nr:ribonuclease P protein component [Thermoclostridium sp.]
MGKLPVLKKNSDFHRVYSKGKYASSESLVIYCVKRKANTVRIGITTSKKVGKSVQRNRMRRLVRENIRLMHEQLAPGMDLVIVVRKADPDANLHSIGREMRFLLKKLDILVRDKDHEGAADNTDQGV